MTLLGFRGALGMNGTPQPGRSPVSVSPLVDLDGDTLPAVGSDVSSWVDAAGRTFSQGTPADQPLTVDGPNGHRAARFQSDWMSSTVGGTTPQTALTVAMVMRLDAVSSNVRGGIVAGLGASSQDDYSAAAGNWNLANPAATSETAFDSLVVGAAPTGGDTDIKSSSHALGSWVVVTALIGVDGVAQQLYTNGTADGITGSSSSNPSLNLAHMNLGVRWYGGNPSATDKAQFSLAALRVYPGRLSADDRAILHSDWSDEYGITVADYEPIVIAVTGTAALTPQAPSLSGAGTSTVTGSGSATAAAAVLAGAGTLRVTGAGGLAAAAASLVGAGTSTVTGASALAPAVATLSGAATLRLVGSVAVTASAATVTGSGTLRLTGSVALAAQPATATSSGTVTVTGQGALAATQPTLAGAGTLKLTGSAALATTTQGVTGAGTVALGGSGALAAAPADLEGAGTITPAGVGTGALVPSAATLSGAGTARLNGTGALTASPATLSGAATSTVVGSGGLTAPAADLAGTGTVTPVGVGTGALVAAPAGLSGVGTLTVVGAAQLNAQAAALAGAALSVAVGDGTLAPAPAALSGSGTVYNPSEITLPTPPERSYPVARDLRAYGVGAENRSARVPAESRTLTTT